MLAILGSIPLHSVAEKNGVQVVRRGPWLGSEGFLQLAEDPGMLRQSDSQ